MQYTCTHGHYIETPAPLTIDRCLAAVHGTRCTGDLKAEGDGSRKENERLAAVREQMLVGA